jgi:uncharacterized NAD-dependent epimerase/dehydratase family protein
MNTELCSDAEALAYQKEYQDRTGIPVVLPIQQGVDALIPILSGLK